MNHIATTDDGKEYDVSIVNLEMNYVKYFSDTKLFQIAGIKFCYFDGNMNAVVYRI